MVITSAKYIADNITGENTHVLAVIDGIAWTVPLNASGNRITEILRQVEDGTLTIADAD